ncbi:MAG: Gfo/Idh/MocA family protein [Propionibacteriaceae bacterium]
MNTGPVGVAIIGAGVISKQYLDNLTQFPDIRVCAVTDLHPEVAKARAEEYGIATHGSPGLALEHPEAEIIVNLTIPTAHVDIDSAAVRAGKHVFSEKPIALDRDSARCLLREADEAGLRVGCAPDTFLGAGLQTARRIIMRGDIGEPLSALTLFQTAGPEAWHPNPTFLFKNGAGPLFDIGPYYFTALAQCLGGFRRVVGISSRARTTRVVQAGPRAGEVFDVEVPTQVNVLAELDGGLSSSSILSWDSPRSRTGVIEITGTEAVLSLPDPDFFDGTLRICRKGGDWEDIPTSGPTHGRGLGVLDMARSIRAGEPHRASGHLAYHVLDTMLSIEQAAEANSFVDIASCAPATSPLPQEWVATDATLSG